MCNKGTGKKRSKRVPELIFLSILFQDRINWVLHARGHQIQEKHHTSNKTDDFFAQIPQEIRNKLYQFCKRDYDMLGYPKPKYIED